MSVLTDQILQEIHSLSRPDQIPFYTHFFRADKGDICYGDKLLAIKIPELRKLVKKYYKFLELEDLIVFLESEYNEIRFFGHQIVSEKYKKSQSIEQKEILIKFLTKHISSINHWNLVDTISDLWGKYCLEIYDFDIIKKFSIDKSIWVRRIAIVSCLQLIKTKNKEYLPLIIQILQNNIDHKHEYIHKAMGWILREVSKTNEDLIIAFLQQNWSKLPSVTRSYSTERIRKTRDIKVLFGAK
jgi:3-methyladenine DNA glycosylase AlkD